VAPTDDNLLRALKNSFQQLRTVPRLSSSAGGGAAVEAARCRRFLEQRAPAVVSDFPSAIVLMRSAGVSDGSLMFGFGCAAHAGNLVAQDAAKIQPFALALRSSLCASMLFMSCRRPRTLHAATVSSLARPGSRPVRGLQGFSRTRWVGEADTIAAVEETFPTLPHTLFLSDTLSTTPFYVPSSVEGKLEAPSRTAFGQSTFFVIALAAVVSLLEADAAPLPSFAGLFLDLTVVIEDLLFLTSPRIACGAAAKFDRALRRLL